MAPLRTSALALAALALPTALAHFSIQFPEQIEPEDENGLSSGPCGGAKLNFDSGPITDFHVDGNYVWLEPSHPELWWLLRVTTDKEGQSNWTAGYDIIKQSGLGEACIPMVTAPKDFVGKTGLLGVVSKAEDGTLYGCSQVMFVEGKGEMPDGCKNGTKNIAFDSENELAALVDDGSAGGSGSGSESGPGTDSAPKETESPDAAFSLRSGPGGVGGILATVSVAMLVGTAFFIF